MFTSMLYYLFFNSIIEAAALPRTLELSKELAAANRPDLYLEICRLLVSSTEEDEKLRLSVMALLRVAMAFMVVGSGLLLLLGLRLLRVGEQGVVSHSTVGRFSPARVIDHLLALWEGKRSLQSALWAFAFPATLISWFAVQFWLHQLKASKALESMLYMSLACGIALTVYLFSLSVVWRCAGNVGRKVWMWLARGAVVLLVVYFAFKAYVAAAFTVVPLFRGLQLL